MESSHFSKIDFLVSCVAVFTKHFFPVPDFGPIIIHLLSDKIRETNKELLAQICGQTSPKYMEIVHFSGVTINLQFVENDLAGQELGPIYDLNLTDNAKILWSGPTDRRVW